MATLYATISTYPYQKSTDSGNNTAYPTGATQAEQKTIKDNRERDQLEFVIHKNFPHATNKQITTAALPELLEEKNNRKKGFTGVLVHELIEYLMVIYGNITEPIKEQEKK